MGTTTLLGPEQHRPDGDLSRLRSAGRAVPGIEIQIADVGSGAILPAGDTGEIQVRGNSLTPGYWRNPRATADAFTADGFFRTGDMGALDDEGFLFIRDRMKDMIITGGENVYPAEVESVLAAFPGVVEVAVVGIPSPKWGETPMAFVVTGGADPDPQDIITFSREKMAHYKCPTDGDLRGCVAPQPIRQDPQARTAGAVLDRARPRGRVSGRRISPRTARGAGS